VTELDDIIKDCKAGKREAQAKLFKLYAKKMYGVCLLYTKDETAAEDILQDGFIRIITNIDKFRGDGSFEGWMRRIMVNLALEQYRKKRYMYAVDNIEDHTEDIEYNDVVDQVSADDLVKMIQELSPQYRMVFSLYAIEGYSHKEIGDMLGISEGASKSNLSRARKILQRRVGMYYQSGRVLSV